MLGCEKVQDRLKTATDEAQKSYDDALINEVEYDDLIETALYNFRKQVGVDRYLEALTRHDSSW